MIASWLLPAVGGALAAAGAIAVIVLVRGRRRRGRRGEAWTRSEILSLASLLTGTALTIVGLAAAGGDDGGGVRKGGDEPPRINAGFLAQLVRQGPFTEPLPAPFRAGRLTAAEIGDPSAADRLDAVELRVNGPDERPAFTSIEVYETPAQAAARGRAARASFAERFGATSVDGTDARFCVALGGAWTCAATHWYAYVEATIPPGANAVRPDVVGTAAAMLRYTDRLTRLAATPAE